MPRSQPKSALAADTFEQLVRGVQETYLKSRRQIEQTVVMANWEAGRLINEHILHHAARADYGEQVIPRLEKRTGINRRLLYQCSQFQRRIPIVHRGALLVWSHYRLLCQVEDDARRASLTSDAAKRKWSVPELEDRVRRLNLESVETEAAEKAENTRFISRQKVDRVSAKRGTPGLYPLVARRADPAQNRVDGLAIDLGFKMYLPLPPEEIRRLKLVAGAIVRTSEGGKLARDDDATRPDLFTYRALDVRVVDGDTLAVTVDLPPHNEIDKKLRLRAINCPELDTPEGKAAKRFVQGLVDQATAVFVTTTKPDKYDRYLADVFLVMKTGEEIFLNNALLESGHAVRMDGNAPSDWE